MRAWCVPGLARARMHIDLCAFTCVTSICVHRICRDGDDEEAGRPLIVPCGCKGSIRYCHLDCLLEWVRRSESERMRRAPLCGVCQQPFKLRSRGPLQWVYHCLASLSSSRCTHALAEGAEHLMSRPCAHMHCHVCRWLLVLLVLQLCLWEGQLLMATMAYRSLKALLLLDAMLDHLLVPETFMPFLHLALPPVCELRPRVLTLGAVGEGPHAQEPLWDPSRLSWSRRRRHRERSQEERSQEERSQEERSQEEAQEEASVEKDEARWRREQQQLLQRQWQQLQQLQRQQQRRHRQRHPLPNEPLATFEAEERAVAGGSPPPRRRRHRRHRGGAGAAGAATAPGTAPGGDWWHALRRVAGRWLYRLTHPFGPTPRLARTPPRPLGPDPTFLGGLASSLASSLASPLASTLASPLASLGASLGLRSLASLPAYLAADVRATLALLPATAQMRRCQASAAATLGATVATADGLGTSAAATAAAAVAGASPPSHWLGGITWRWLLPLDGDVLLVSACVLVWNGCLAHWLLSTPRHRALRIRLVRRLRRFGDALEPFAHLLPLDTTAEDGLHALLQLGCAAYCGRVVAERAGWLAPHASALDLGACHGLGLHAALGLLAWGAWSAVSTACTALQDHFVEWRWVV